MKKGKVLSVILAAATIVSMTACGSSGTATTTPVTAATTKAAAATTKAAAATTKAAAATTAKAAAAATTAKAASSAKAQKLTLWSKFSLDSENGKALQYLVDDFNKTNGKNISVDVKYIEGGTSGIMSAVMTAVAAGTTPEMIMMDNSTVPILAENGVIADVSKYVKAGNYDMKNIIDNMSLYSYYKDQVISIPFARSNVVYVYNKDIFDKYQLQPPKTFADLENIGKTIKEKESIPSFCMLFDASYYQEAMLVGMGSNGNISKDGKTPAALNDGTMERLLTTWSGWIKDGWCMAPNVTDAENTMKEAFYNKKLAAFICSTGALKGIYNAAEKAGVNVQVANMPGEKGYASGSGGSQIAAVAPGKSQEQISACWDFMQYMMGDMPVSYFSVNSGYLPTTKTSLTTQTLTDYWKKYPGFKVAIDQMSYASEPYWSIYRNDWNAVVKTAMSDVTQNGKSVSDAIAYMKSQVNVVFK